MVIKLGRRLMRAFVCSLIIILAGCSEYSEDPLRIGIHVWPGYDTLILAREKGYIGDPNVKLIELPSASESIRAMQNHTIDGALLTIDEVLRLAENGHEPRIILIMDFSNGADAVLGRPEISELADLKGKSIGVEPNALGAYMLARALAAANLKPADVKLVSMPISEMELAYQDGRVDAVVTYEPHRTRIMEKGARILFDSTRIPGEITDVLVVRKDVIDRSPKAIQSLVDAQFEALKYLSQHPKKAAAIMAPRENVTSAQFLDSLQRLVLPDRATNQKLLSSSDQTIPQTIRGLVAVMRSNKILKSDPSGLEYRDDRFVRGPD